MTSSSRRFAAILLVAGIVGVLVLVLLALRSSQPRVVGSLREAKADSVESQARLDAPEESAPARGRAAVAPLDDEVPSEPGERWRVCVVDASTSAAVAGAAVSVVDLSAFERLLSERGIGIDTLEGLRLRRERTVEATTGVDGCASFSVPPEHALVEARSGAGWAFTVIDRLPAERCVTLTLAPDHALLVRVLDSAGAPVGGVPVALRLQVDAGPAFFRKWTDTEPGTGLAAFQHFQRRLEQGAGWHVLFAFPLRNPTSIPVDESTPLDSPITLVLPDTGRLRIRVRTPLGGVPELDGAGLQLDALERDGARIWPGAPWSRPRLGDGCEALLPWIGLGLDLRVALVRDDAELVARSIAGPTRADEEVSLELVLSQPSVTGRFVLSAGRAWPASIVQVQAELFPAPEQALRVREIAVESDGRFRMALHDACPVGGGRELHFSAQHPVDQGEVIAVVPLDQEVPPEGLDLGDILLDYGERLASGRVVDAARRPIEGASISARTHTLASGREFWPQIRVAGTARTAGDGEFVLYLPPGEARPSDELRLAASAEGFVGSDQRGVRRGESNVELVLTRAGALAGSIELDGGLGTDDLTLFLTGEARQLVTLRPDGAFEVRALLPGTYSLAVRWRDALVRLEREPAVLVEGLLVRAGETCRDPRIQALRVESVLPTLRIRTVDRASTPLGGAVVTIIGPGTARSTVAGDDGVCLVRCEALPVELEVAAFGYARQRLVNVSADREVVLDAGFPIRLRTSAAPSGSDPRYLLGVFLYSVDAAGVRRGPAWGQEYTTDYATDRSHFDEHGELALRMPAAGAYECDAFVTVLSGGVGRGAPVELSPTPRIQVLASPAEQLFELTIPQHAVRAAIETALR